MTEATATLADIVAEPAPVAKTEPEKVEAQAEPETVETEAAAEGEEGAEQAQELAEWEDDDGTKYSIPPALVPKLLKNKDYTTKTQALAEQRKAFAAQEAEFEALRKRDAEDLKVETEIYQLSEAVKRYETVDWDRLADEDLTRAQREQFNLQRIRDRLATLNVEKAKRHNERSEAHRQSTVKRMQEAEEYAAANIPGWGAERSAELWKYATEELGYAEHALVQSLDARLMKLIHKAWIGDKAMAKAKAPVAKQTAATVEPLRTVQAKSTPTTRRNLASADYDTYHEMIKAGADPTLASL